LLALFINPLTPLNVDTKGCRLRGFVSCANRVRLVLAGCGLRGSGDVSVGRFGGTSIFVILDFEKFVLVGQV
jgi:hypothetical protein